jgi:GntP family gluconate:H+ symporter
MAAAVVIRQRGISLAALGRMLAAPLETAGVIILITSAGGAFGVMLSHAGVGEAVQAAAEGRELNLVLLAWVVAAVIRVAQGSATVAMLTTAAMVYPLLGAGLPYDPVYIFLSIGFGAMTLSWMNDSGFWVVCKLSGFTEQETLKTWTVMATTNSLVGLATCLVMARILPRIPGF